MYKDTPLSRYIDDLAAKIPAPGGGSASALTASLGAALLSMVLNFTIGKPKYEKYQDELKILLNKTEKLKVEFLRLVDLDVVAYQSKDIRQALDVVLILARLCYEAMEILPEITRKSNVNLISDVAVAAIFIESAFSSACFNVDINLKYIDDNDLAKKISRELHKKAQRVKKIRRETEDRVGEIIRG